MTRNNRVLYIACVVLAIATVASALFVVINKIKPKPLPYNVILVSLDTLRADRLGCYGYDKETSPAIDTFSKNGTRFANAFAPSPWTLPSHMSIFTGLLPSAHDCIVKKRQLSPNIDMLAEILKGNGYRTYADTGGGYVDSEFGFSRGFEIYGQAGWEPFLNKVDRAKEWLGRIQDENFFVFLHTYDIHSPYYPTIPKYREMFQPEHLAGHMSTKMKTENYFNRITLSQEQKTYISNEYDADIRQTDDALKVLFEHLDNTGLLENTIVIILSDHGEELFDHGRIGHHKNLYIESLHVPFIIVGPGIKKGVVKENVDISSVMPTVLELLNIRQNQATAQSLAPFLKDNIDNYGVELPVFGEINDRSLLRSIIFGRHHLIYNLVDEKYELYNFFEDRKEQDDVYTKEQNLATRYKSILSRKMMKEAPVENTIPIGENDEQKEWLKSLGYL